MIWDQESTKEGGVRIEAIADPFLLARKIDTWEAGLPAKKREDWERSRTRGYAPNSVNGERFKRNSVIRYRYSIAIYLVTSGPIAPNQISFADRGSPSAL